MSLAGRALQQRVPFPTETVWNTLIPVLDAPDNRFSVESADPLLFKITATTGMSLTSWGENIAITVTPIDERSCVVSVDSSPRFGLDWFAGRLRRRNFEAVVNALSAALAEHTGVFCTQCRTRNPASASWCHACGALLAAPERVEAPRPQAQPAPATPVPRGTAVGAVIFCPQCRTQNALGSRWCTRCGAALAAPSAGVTAGSWPPLAAAYAQPRRRTRSRTLRWLRIVGLFLLADVAIFAVLGVIGLILENRNKFDPERGYVLAHASLLPPRVLPGGGWSMTKVDDFTNAPIPSPSCEALNTRMTELVTKLEQSQAGRAAIEFTRAATDPRGSNTQVGGEVYIHKNGKTAADFVDQYRHVWDSPDVLGCLETAAKEEGASVTAVKAAPSAAAPNGGYANAYDLTLATGDARLVLRVESYAWAFSNAFLIVTFTGPQSMITNELVAAALLQAQVALDRTAQAPPTPVASPSAQAVSGTTPTAVTVGGQVVDAALVTWGRAFCRTVDRAAVPQPPDVSKLPFDQAKAVNLQYVQAWSDRQDRQLNQFVLLQPPSRALGLQEEFVRSIGAAKRLHDTAIAQFGAARAPDELNVAVSAFNAGIQRIQHSINEAYRKAPPDVLAAASCTDIDPDLLVWGTSMCGVLTSLSGISSINDVKIAGVPFDQAKTALIEAARGALNTVGKAQPQLLALRPPSKAAPVHDAIVALVAAGKGGLEALVNDASTARTAADLNAAVRVYDTWGSAASAPSASFDNALKAAPAEVRQALTFCN